MTRIDWKAARTKRRVFIATLPLLAGLMLLPVPTWAPVTGWAVLGLYILLAGEPTS